MPRLSPSQRRAILRSLLGQGGNEPTGFRRLARKFGPVGELIGMIAEILAGGRGKPPEKQPSDADIEAAVKLLQGEGYEITPEGPPMAGPPVIVQPRRPVTPSGPMQPTRPTPAIGSVGRRSGVQPSAQPWPEESTIPILPTRIRGAMTQIPFEDFTPWILTPQSTHVHAIAYDEGNGVLFVQYRESAPPIGYVDMVSICSGKAYKCGIRPDVPGPIYSYGGAGRPVPKSIFLEMLRTKHVGRVVWDKLRVCGSHWQHRYPYTAVDVPQGQAIPRKAVRTGYAVRSVPTIGMGRRGARQSTLPAQRFR